MSAIPSSATSPTWARAPSRRTSRATRRLSSSKTAEHIETGRKKVGAILGDYVEVGCNSVLNPGTVIGRHSNIYPVSCVRGVIPADSILKSSGEVVHKK